MPSIMENWRWWKSAKTNKMINNINMVRFIYLFAVVCLNISCIHEKDSIALFDLKTEHLKAPLGIDTPEPRFSWKTDAESQGTYHIYVGTDSTAVAQGKGDIWDVYREADSTLISYRGKPLQPFTKYHWGVQVTSKDGRKSKISTSSFEMGTMDTANSAILVSISVGIPKLVPFLAFSMTASTTDG